MMEVYLDILKFILTVTFSAVAIFMIVEWYKIVHFIYIKYRLANRIKKYSKKHKDSDLKFFWVDASSLGFCIRFYKTISYVKIVFHPNDICHIYLNGNFYEAIEPNKIERRLRRLDLHSNIEYLHGIRGSNDN